MCLCVLISNIGEKFKGMEKLKIDIENCYGIKSLATEFDFSKDNAVVIYAANGAMKSSLAQTFKDVADDVPSKDRIFPARISKRVIADEKGTSLPKDNVVVIRPYDEVFAHTEKTSTLLVDSKLRQEYEKLHIEINISKDVLLKSLREISNSKKDLESEISSTFTKSPDDFFLALIRIKEELINQKDAPFAELSYDNIFDDKDLALLNTKDFKSAIQEYIEKYNELLSASTYFKKGVFNYYNGATIAKSLADNGFFEAKHSVSLNAETKIEITTEKELETLINSEKDNITHNEDLRKKFAEIEKQMNKNINLRDFHSYLLEHEDLLPHLANLDKFREEIWKSYLKVKIDLYLDVVKKYQDSEKRKKEIEEEAGKQRTQWESVIQIFNNRFYVPFTLSASNRTAVILGQDPLLVLGFIFNDGKENAPIGKADLLKVLSTGEKKALYILNIIFEVEVRKKDKQETVFVVDDIADSFDYKNKYAIIEYLKDISEEPNFQQIILTHNFDFFRTIHSRFVPYANCYMAFKSSTGLSLEKATGFKNVFVNDWKPNFYQDNKKKIASIPFIRNLVEYTKGDQDPHYLKLTSLLHLKDDSASITHAELDSIYNNIFNEVGGSPNPQESVITSLMQSADECLKAGEGINFENKIVLSIAIRIAAENHMITKINDMPFVSSLNGNQTIKLFKKYKIMFSTDTASIDVLQRVLLMTPESIHLNSFMYEPILDMSDEHLRRLFEAVKELS